MSFPFEAVLFAFLLVMAVMIARQRALFAAALMTSMFGLLSASMFTLMDAVDVAFTEASVGAGFSTVLMLGALALTSNREKKHDFRPLPLLVVLVTGGALLYGTLDMPRYGDPAAPIHQHVAPDYIRGSEKDIGIPNIVTAVLASYRSYDTYGETTVIFTAGVGVILLLSGRLRRRRDQESEKKVPGADS